MLHYYNYSSSKMLYNLANKTLVFVGRNVCSFDVKILVFCSQFYFVMILDQLIIYFSFKTIHFLYWNLFLFHLVPFQAVDYSAKDRKRKVYISKQFRKPKKKNHRISNGDAGAITFVLISFRSREQILQILNAVPYKSLRYFGASVQGFIAKVATEMYQVNP